MDIEVNICSIPDNVFLILLLSDLLLVRQRQPSFLDLLFRKLR